MNLITLLIMVAVIVLIKWSLAPRKNNSMIFVIYKSAVMLIAWLGAVFTLTGFIPAFAGASTVWLMVFAAVLFSLPTFIIFKEA